VEIINGRKFNSEHLDCVAISKSAVKLGADLVVQSSHKTLSVLSQGSVLHCNSNRVDINRVRKVVSLLQTTSPNYVILSSLDVARKQMSLHGKKLVDEMKWYDDYLIQGKVDRSANTSPGNKRGGLSTIVEKALGSVAKAGKSTIVDVLGPGEKIRRKGLTFAATPASDFICGTLQLAAGMNMHVFMTGRGTPYGLSMVPVIKVGSNSKISQRWYDLIDFDAGKVATGEKTIEELGWELFQLILDVASGKKIVACDKLGLHNDLVLFNPGPIT